MLGINLPDLAIIAFVAILMFGPDRVPELARGAALLVKNLRTLATKAQGDLRRELGPEFADFRLTDLDPRQAVRRHVLEALESMEIEPRPRTTSTPGGLDEPVESAK